MKICKIMLAFSGKGCYTINRTLCKRGLVCPNVRAVSYTHLDVYKRQDYTLADDAEWTEEKLVDAILEQELPNGGFGLTEEANVDITAMAVTALAPYCQENPQASEAVQRSLSLLSGWQESDGTMALYGERTAESTAWTLNALTACGLDPVTEEAFIKRCV